VVLVGAPAASRVTVVFGSRALGEGKLMSKDFTGVIRGATPAGTERIKVAQRRLGVVDDGALGPVTISSLLYALADILPEAEQPTQPATPRAMSEAEARARVVAWALARVGELDPVTEVWPGICDDFAVPACRHTKAWCGGFVLRAWRDNLPGCAGWKWDGGFALQYGVKRVGTPDAGDLRISQYVEPYYDARGYLIRPADASVQIWHHSLVTRVRGDGNLDTVDGNTLQGFRNGKQLEGVTTRTVPIIGTGVAYYSMAAYV
jgi:hypothetical protein